MKPSEFGALLSLIVGIAAGIGSSVLIGWGFGFGVLFGLFAMAMFYGGYIKTAGFSNMADK